ncbi:MAG: LAGLIDADG family homing endonuclease [Candidatus Coprovivens sp.]
MKKIRSEIGNENQIVKVLHPLNNKLIDTLTYSSKKMCEDLTKLGAFRNKSLTLKFPDFLDSKLMSHFIRGYFDGDGCVWNGKRKKMTVKDSTRESGFRERIIHNVKFTFTGNYEFINSLQDYLVSIGIVSKKTKLNFSKAKNKNNNTSENVCTMEYSGRKQLKRFYDFIYSEATIYMDRKKLKFEEIFCASLEKSNVETVLIEETPEMVIVS